MLTKNALIGHIVSDEYNFNNKYIIRSLQNWTSVKGSALMSFQMI